MKHGSRRRSIAALLTWLAHSCVSPACPAAERCHEAQAVEEPCAGVLLPRDWAIEAVACKKALPEAMERARILQEQLDKAKVAKPERAWYAETWAGFLIGIPTGVAVVWLVQEMRR